MKKGLVIRFMQSNVKFVDQFLFIVLVLLMVKVGYVKHEFVSLNKFHYFAYGEIYWQNCRFFSPYSFLLVRVL
jgi:hypothetical protein